jgi:hypothetical protein
MRPERLNATMVLLGEQGGAAPSSYRTGKLTESGSQLAFAIIASS